MKERIAVLRGEQERLARLRTERLAFGASVAAFESTVESAIELTAFPLGSVDTPDYVEAVMRTGAAQAEALAPPEGATDEARALAAALLQTWNEIARGLALRAAECEGSLRTSTEEARVHAECVALGHAYRAWEARMTRLLTPDASLSVANASAVTLGVDMATAQLPQGDMYLQRAAQLRALLQTHGVDGSAGSAVLPSHEEMSASLIHLRDMAHHLSVAAAAAPPPSDAAAMNAAIDRLVASGGAGALPHSLSRLLGEGAGESGVDRPDPFPLDAAPPAATAPQDAEEV